MSTHKVHDRTIAVLNGKGGAGKTSIVANLGGLFAVAGYRVLLVDLDPQGNLADDLGYANTALADEGSSLREAIISGQAVRPAIGVRPNLDVVPGGQHLLDLTDIVMGRQRRGAASATLLADSLTPTARGYDLVLIDCPPGEEILQELALIASRWILIPTKTDGSSRKGLHRVAERYAAVRQVNPHLELLGVLLFATQSNARRVSSEARELIRSELRDAAPVFETAIRAAEATAFDCRQRGQLAHELEQAVAGQAPWYETVRSPGEHGQRRSRRLAGSASNVAGDYENLADEVLKALQERESREVGAHQ